MKNTKSKYDLPYYKSRTSDERVQIGRIEAAIRHDRKMLEECTALIIEGSNQLILLSKHMEDKYFQFRNLNPVDIFVIIDNNDQIDFLTRRELRPKYSRLLDSGRTLD